MRRFKWFKACIPLMAWSAYHSISTNTETLVTLIIPHWALSKHDIISHKLTSVRRHIEKGHQKGKQCCEQKKSFCCDGWLSKRLWVCTYMCDQFCENQSCPHELCIPVTFSTRNNSWPLAILWTISTFGWPKSILVGQFYCTFSMGWQLITYKMSYLQKNGWPISDPYFYHCTL